MSKKPDLYDAVGGGTSGGVHMYADVSELLSADPNSAKFAFGLQIMSQAFLAQGRELAKENPALSAHVDGIAKLLIGQAGRILEQG